MNADANDIGASRAETLARLAQSRAEIKRLLEPPAKVAGQAGGAGGLGGDDFPRSRTMRALLSGRGIGTVGAIFGGLLMTRPALVLRLLRMVPAGPIARMLIVKAISSLRGAAKR
jgi:hypothetical protein